MCIKKLNYVCVYILGVGWGEAGKTSPSERVTFSPSPTLGSI